MAGGFRLLWNGKAMIEWNHREDADEDVSIYTPERAAEMLYLMHRRRLLRAASTDMLLTMSHS